MMKREWYYPMFGLAFCIICYSFADMSLTPVFFAVSLLLLINTRSHKSWVSGVQWSPTDPFVLATTSHDGTLKVRTQYRNLLLSLSKPLLTINVN